ncbi:MAG: trans-aconitate 2-methyltransferase [Mycobacterium sp.]
MWKPDVYLAFADHRGRPYYELLARVNATAPRRVADLGCGPGNLTVTLKERWPDAVIEAVDSSPEMVAAARERGLQAREAELQDWTPEPDTDVAVSNAALHWVPNHAELMVRWVSELAPGSWLAVQVPGNFDAPSHATVRELASSQRWVDRLSDLPYRVGSIVDTAAGYAGFLTDAGCTVDAWETTYIHELTGEHPVLDWITGSALTFVKERLSDDEWQEFRAEVIPLHRAAYPPRTDGITFYPFRRIFVVAQVG